MRIFLEPQETLLFRNGRPFDAGEVGYAETVFPPTPETLQGVVRSMIATQYATSTGLSLAQVFRIEEFVTFIGNRNTYGCFRISDIALAKRKDHDVELLYPVPAHVVEDDKGKLRLKPVPNQHVRSNMPEGMHYLVPERPTTGKIEPVEGWLTLTDLRTVLQPGTDIRNLHIIRAGEIYQREPRVGIGMDSARKITEEGLLYSTQMVRMKEGYGFLITAYIATDRTSHEKDEQATRLIEGALQKSGRVTMGGEQRAARFEILPDTVSTNANSGRLLYLATPAVLSKGWQPAQWTTKTPIAAAISRYQLIGGWSLDTASSGGGDQKRMRRCVPAGSVYFFDQPVPLSALSGDHQDSNTNPTYIGYGITMTGDWQA